MRILEGIKKYSNTTRAAVTYVDSDKKSTLSYLELEKKSNSLARFILENSNSCVKTETEKKPIPIHGGKEPSMLICMMAALKSGRAYVPLDVSFPPTRSKSIIDEVCPDIYIDVIDGIVSYGEGKKISLDEIFSIYGDSEIDRKTWVKGDENAYILFTSGSTGKPKGVQISANNLHSFEPWMSGELGINGDEMVVMDQPAYSFDLSVTEVYTGLTNGATLFSISKDVANDFKSLFGALENSNINVWISTPTFVSLCLANEDFSSNMMTKLSKFLFIGEVLPREVAHKLLERFPKADVINGYGPTEATVGVSTVKIKTEHVNAKRSLPVGNPMPGHFIFTSESPKGEIIIAGPSVSKGYYKNQDKTKASFIFIDSEDLDKYSDCKDFYVLKKLMDDYDGHVPAYKTGDVGEISDGQIYYHGRTDFQVKLGGYRIEIEDIESNLRKLEEVDNAVVVPIYKEEKISYLRAYVKLDENYLKSNGVDSVDAKTIKNNLAKRVPKYMVPRNIRFLDSFPINTNGKIDRKALMEK